jgi:hypothetical protein
MQSCYRSLAGTTSFKKHELLRIRCGLHCLPVLGTRSTDRIWSECYRADQIVALELPARRINKMEGPDAPLQPRRSSWHPPPTAASGRWVAVYFNPNGLPAVRSRIASLRRLAFVSSCLAVSIHPIYRRRCEGARPPKYRHAAGCFLNAAWM